MGGNGGSVESVEFKVPVRNTCEESVRLKQRRENKTVEQTLLCFGINLQKDRWDTTNMRRINYTTLFCFGTDQSIL